MLSRKSYIICGILVAFHVLTINFILFKYTFKLDDAKDTIAVSLSRLRFISHDDEDEVVVDDKTSQDMFTNDELDLLDWKDMTLDQKLQRKMKEVDTSAPEHWMINTTLKFTDLTLDLKDFIQDDKLTLVKRLEEDTERELPNLPDEEDPLPEPKAAVRMNFANNNTLWYDLRFTLALYLDYIKVQFAERNPTNKASLKRIEQVEVPFHWSDWTDMEVLNDLILKKKMSCEELIATSEWNSADAGYCIDERDITSKMLSEMGLHSTDQLPGFAITKPPDNVATPRTKLIDAKAHLLTYGQLPLSLIFLTDKGYYEVGVNERQRIVDSPLIESYMKTHDIRSVEEPVTVNAVKEYEALLKTVPPRISEPIEGSNVVINYEQALREHHYKLVLDPDLFHYDTDTAKQILAEYDERLDVMDEMSKNTDSFDEEKFYELSLNDHEKNHYDSLKFSMSRTPDNQDVYFKLARMLPTDGNEEDGWHIEWRFFNGRLTYEQDRHGKWTHQEVEERHKIIVYRLLRTWSQFCYQLGVIQWVNHGALLSWYWNGISFPYDDDVDVQLPAKVLDNFARRFNQSMVIEEVDVGYGRYFIDCNAYMTIRTHGNGLNNIDARFIDVDSGAYIDITALTLTNQAKPERYDELKGKNRNELYNCRNNHFYHIDELSPLKFTLLEGCPLLIPRNFTSLLGEEYSNGFTSLEYAGWYFVKPLRLWLPGSTIKKVLKMPIDLENEREHILARIADLKPRHVLKFLENEEVMNEFYLTYKDTGLHEREKEILFDNAEKMSAENVERYVELASNFKMRSPPLRKSYFEYEYIERDHFKEKIRKLKEYKEETDEEDDVAEHLKSVGGY